jgi:3-oxoacyl-[acyl-carrier-protein] synthase-3
VIGRSNGVGVTIAGLGCQVPDRVLTNEEISRTLDTSDEWIRERTGIRERRVAGPEEALSDLALPACQAALEQAGLDASELGLIVVATVTPDMMFPSTYDLLAGCTGFMYALAQGYGMVASGLTPNALVVGGDTLSKIVDWNDRSTCILFGDGAGAVVLRRVGEGGFLGFELGAEGAGGVHLYYPGSGSRDNGAADGRDFVKMNGREVYKFATRVLVSSAEKILAECGRTIDDVDVYVPHQANVRIIEHASKKLGIPQEKVIVNVDRYGNTSSASIPLALADAAAQDRLKPGKLVLMTGMGAGLTWGSALIEWTEGMAA